MHAEKLYAAEVRKFWLIAIEQGQLWASVNLLLCVKYIILHT